MGPALPAVMGGHSQSPSCPPIAVMIRHTTCFFLSLFSPLLSPLTPFLFPWEENYWCFSRYSSLFLLLCFSSKHPTCSASLKQRLQSCPRPRPSSPRPCLGGSSPSPSSESLFFPSSSPARVLPLARLGFHTDPFFHLHILSISPAGFML